MDGVFSLQRAGTDAVFAYQYPVEADALTSLGGKRKRRRISSLVGEQAEVEEVAALLAQLFTEGVFNG